MKIFKQIFCKHDWHFHGWSYVKCKKCERTKYDPNLNAKLQSTFWEKRIIEGDPVFGREAINSLLRTRGRSI